MTWNYTTWMKCHVSRRVTCFQCKCRCLYRSDTSYSKIRNFSLCLSVLIIMMKSSWVVVAGELSLYQTFNVCMTSIFFNTVDLNLFMQWPASQFHHVRTQRRRRRLSERLSALIWARRAFSTSFDFFIVALERCTCSTRITCCDTPA